MSMSASSTSSAPGSATSLRAQTRSNAMSGHLDRLLVEAGERAETLLDRAHEAVLQLRDADVLDDVGEEAADDQAPRGLGVDATRAQVEQLLVVEPAGGAGVPGADDLAGLDLQVGHGVGTGAVGEHQVAVELVGVGADGGGPDADVADPDRVRVLALQRALVEHVAAAVGDRVVDPEPVLLVLGLVGEVDAEQVRAASGAGVLDVADQADEVAAEGHHDLLEGGVPADDGVVLAAVD